MSSLTEIWNYSIKEINLLYPNAEISSDPIKSKIDIASYLYHYNLLSEEDIELFKKFVESSSIKNIKEESYSNINPIEYLGTDKIIKEEKNIECLRNEKIIKEEKNKNNEYDTPIVGNLKFHKIVPKVDTWQIFY